MRRPRQDNADAFTLLGAEYLRAWVMLAGVECPPSLEVFNEGYFSTEIDKAPVSPSEYAEYLVNRYKRTDVGSFSAGEGPLKTRYSMPWYEFHELVGRLIGK